MHRILTRQTWLKVHLYLALTAGFFFALMGLTGSISVYREEIDALLNPQLVIEQPQGQYQSLDRIMAAVRQAHPDRYGAGRWKCQDRLTAWRRPGTTSRERPTSSCMRR
jgi:uncharacterized iron-regulated membrane protein